LQDFKFAKRAVRLGGTFIHVYRFILATARVNISTARARALDCSLLDIIPARTRPHFYT